MSSVRSRTAKFALHSGRDCIELRRSLGEDDADTIDVFAAESNLSRLLPIDIDENIGDIDRIDLVLDTNVYSLTSLRLHLPKLQHVNLSGSRLGAIRDLGSALRHVRVLSLAKCDLDDLDGITACFSLTELYLAYNRIRHLAGIAFVESSLELLDLEGNAISNMNEMTALESLPELQHLTLALNPISYQPLYRYEVCRRASPALRTLDEEDVADVNRKQSVADSAVPDERVQDAFDTIIKRIRTGPVRGLEAGNQLAALDAVGHHRQQPTSPRWTPPTNDIWGVMAAAGSDLTLGDVVCGSPVLALRARRQSRSVCKVDFHRPMARP